jgi:hypothetical protein
MRADKGDILLFANAPSPPGTSHKSRMSPFPQQDVRPGQGDLPWPEMKREKTIYCPRNTPHSTHGNSCYREGTS